MKKLNQLILSLFFIFFLFVTCSKDDPIIQYLLTVEVTPSQGGSVSNSSGTYDNGETISLFATPSSEYVFKNWTGGVSGTDNPITIVMNSNKNITANFEKMKYSLTIEVEGEGIVEEVIKVQGKSADYSSGSVLELTAKPLDGWLFKEWKGDITGSNNPAQITMSNAKTVTAVFEKITSIAITNPIDELIITHEYFPEIKGRTVSGLEISITDFVILSDDKVTIVDKKIVGAKSGDSSIEINYGDLKVTSQFYVNPIEEITNIDSYLTIPASNSKILVPVVVINYYATLNGIDIDTKRQPNYYSLDPITIDKLKTKTIDELTLTKYGIEEGSKFRGFNNSTSDPNVGIKVIKYYNIYEIKKTMSPDNINYFADYFDMFSKINLEDAVNNLGVKEVWFSLRPLSSEYPVVESENLSPDNFQAGGHESNMSSPTSGDVSNSYRVQNDLPIYNKTYVLYTYNLQRSHAENIHNHGHQIEAQLDYLDEGVLSNGERLFLNKFVGVNYSIYSGKPFGRCGMTHFPPNTTVDYDWNNPTVVKSDIEDWKPEGGVQKDINNSKWMNINYSYPSISYSVNENDDQYKWIMFWFQTIPGNNNDIKYGDYTISNWWDLLYNWDDAIRDNKTLWE